MDNLNLSVIIMFFSVLIIILIINSTFNSEIKECLTLKTDCELAKRSCFIACTTKDWMLNNKCYRECMLNSPVC